MAAKDFHMTTIGDALKKFIDKHKLSPKLTETWMLENWEKIMGATIARHTTKVFLKDKVVHIYLDSPVLKNELTYNRQKVVDLINTEAGYTAVDDVVVR